MESAARVHQPSSKASAGRTTHRRSRRSATPQRLEQLEQSEIRRDDGATGDQSAEPEGTKNRSTSTLIRVVRRPDTPENNSGTGSTTTNASSASVTTSLAGNQQPPSSDGVTVRTRRRGKSRTPTEPGGTPVVVPGEATLVDEPTEATVEVVAVDLESGVATLETVPGGPGDEKIQKGILGYMDRQLKVQSLSDPQKSPAQRSTRSRSSLEKSPRRKRSKSESRRRRERKMLAAGEMEVRQANETLMRYLKQCSDFNDASLSGDLEIPEHLEDRRVHRKTKSQRERKAHQLQPSDHRASGTRSSHADDLLSYHGEIYNPFTPVVSPTTEGAPTRIDKMYIQTASGYRPVDNTYSYHKTTAMIAGGDPESNSNTISTSVHLSCAVQRVWHLLSTICHGLLGGLAFGHLLLICTTKPYDWMEASIRHYSSFAEVYANTFYCLAIVCMVSIFDRVDIAHGGDSNISFRSVFVIMIYVMTIILSLSAGSMDERLYLTPTLNVTVWEEELETNKVLSIWNALSIARSVGAIFGWLVVGFLPNQDNLYDQLLEMEKYQLQ
ncbi:uncharacterized protein LOC126574718 [Anopheles aquasalis]|uniref:uncharacterized protein LOC126574718 n=1 Tax=Anopheles aquasalis TaxID=42839 RepID=UPI00215A88FC|nr:uncharacterized protein LOC126574718 [Anopheles aquasalis]